MTFFTLFFGYLALTEIYDDTEMMYCKPKAYKKELIRRVAEQRRLSQNDDAHNRAEMHRAVDSDNDRNDNDQNIGYEILLCGSLRRCLYCKPSEASR